MSMKNVLVITGSPRKNGNSAQLADAFIKGAMASGHSVSRFDAGFKTIGGCKACNACWSKGAGKPCVFDDDFAELGKLLAAADVVVFCTPVYWFGMSAQIKLAIDKLYSFVRPNCPNKLKIKESYLLACAGDDDDEVFNGTVGTYHGIANYMKWHDKGVLTAKAVYDIGDVAKTKFIARAEEMGKGI